MYRLDARELAARLSEPRAVARMLGCDKGVIRQARGIWVCCPVHKEKSPSMSLRIGRDGLLQAKCFGCPTRGNIFSLIAAIEGWDLTLAIDFKRALERAAELAGGANLVATYEPPPPELPGITDEEAHELGERVLALGRLDGSQRVRQVERYLDKRRLLRAAREAGWAALPGLERLGSDELLERAGLLRTDPQTGEMRPVWPAHRLVIPWRLPDGRIHTLQRRLVADARDRRVPPYVFLRKRIAKEPYACERLRPGVPIAWVEGAVDAEALMRITDGKLIALGLPGVNGWISAWSRYADGRRVYIATDADKPGEDCAAQIAHDCRGGERRRAPAGQDWGDVWRIKAPTP